MPYPVFYKLNTNISWRNDNEIMYFLSGNRNHLIAFSCMILRKFSNFQDRSGVGEENLERSTDLLKLVWFYGPHVFSNLL